METIKWKQKAPVFSYNKKDNVQNKLAAIHGIEDINRFLNPTNNELHSPLLLKNIDLAVKRIIKAIQNKERIGIFPDPDSDGVNSGAIIYNYLKNFVDEDNLVIFHGQRSWGHGINTAMHLVPKDISLLIIVDSSSNDAEEMKLLNQAGIDIVTIDHHLIEDENPYCILVNPQQKDCQYPNKNSSGAVITWKVITAIDNELKTNYNKECIDLVAIGLLGDQMNMLQEYENRYIVNEGLKNIRNKGIKTLLSFMGKDANNLSSTSVLFSIVPAINSACRLDCMEIALKLLIEEDPKICKELAQEVIKLNDKRKKEQNKFKELLINQIKQEDKCSIIIGDVHAGYRGLIAGEFADKFKKPVIVVSEMDDGTYKGSYRSNDFDLKSVLNSIPEIEYAAGHNSAGGVGFKRENLKSIQAYLNENLPDFERDCLEYVLEFDIDEINEQLIKEVEEFYRVNGNGFNVGLFKINNVFILDKQILGKENNTIKLGVCSSKYAYKHKSWGYDSLDPTHYLMKFRTTEDYISDKYLYKEVQVIGQLNLNVWTSITGKTTKTKQIFMEDFKLVY